MRLILMAALAVLVASSFLGSIANNTTGQTQGRSNPGVNIQAALTNNPGFENDSCPKDQDHLTCGWLINSQDCTFLSVCANIISSVSPEGKHMLSLNGTVGQSQQNNDLLSNVTGTISQTPALEFFVRWNTITSCQNANTGCLFRLNFVFNANSKTANFYWTNSPAVFASSFVNSSSALYVSVSPQCGTLAVSSSFCHYYNSNFMSQLQAYFSNTLTSYGFGTGTGTQHGITIAYSIDFSYGCYIVSTGVCNLAAWGLNTDYIVAGGSSTVNNNVTSSPGLPSASGILPLFVPIFAVGFIIAEYRARKSGSILITTRGR